MGGLPSVRSSSYMGSSDGSLDSAADLWAPQGSLGALSRPPNGMSGGLSVGGGPRSSGFQSSSDGIFRFDVNLSRFRQVPPMDAPRQYGVVRTAVILPSLAKFLSVDANPTGSIEVHNERGNFVSYTEQNIWKGWPELDVGDTVEFVLGSGFGGAARAEHIKLLIPAPAERHRGHLIRFLKDKGIGYVKCKSFQQDVYFYFTELFTEDGRAIITDGAEVEFQLARKGNHADNRPAAHRITLRLVPQRVETVQGLVQFALSPSAAGGPPCGGSIRVDLPNRTWFLSFQEADLLHPAAQLSVGDHVVCQLCFHELSPTPYVVNVAPRGTQMPSAEQVIRVAAASAAASAQELHQAQASGGSGASSNRQGVFGMAGLYDAMGGGSQHCTGIVLMEHLPEYLVREGVSG